MAKEIKLSQGKITIVDDEDYEFLSKWKWHLDSTGYAVKNVKLSNNTRRMLLMHRLITLAHKDEQCDHINRNKLDNRKSNLRICTDAENKRNKSAYSNNASGYKGVSWNKRDEKWRAKISVNHKYLYIGSFENIMEAAKAYDEAALKHHGEFAYLNLPTEQIMGGKK